MTSAHSDDDGAAISCCPSRHPDTPRTPSGPPNGSGPAPQRDTPGGTGARCGHGAADASWSLRARWPSGQSGRAHDGRNASWCWHDRPRRSCTERACSLAPGSGASIPTTAIREQYVHRSFPFCFLSNSASFGHDRTSARGVFFVWPLSTATSSVFSPRVVTVFNHSLCALSFLFLSGFAAIIGERLVQGIVLSIDLPAVSSLLVQ